MKVQAVPVHLLVYLLATSRFLQVLLARQPLNTRNNDKI